MSCPVAQQAGRERARGGSEGNPDRNPPPCCRRARHDLERGLELSRLRDELDPFTDVSTMTAGLLSRVGRHEEAIEWLRVGVDERDIDMVTLKTFPMWYPL